MSTGLETLVISGTLGKTYYHNLAKVGVEGSNPFARSKISLKK